MADIILVHGAFHGGWCWRDSAALLRSDGHRVFTPTLTGLAESHHLLNEDVDVGTHAQDIVNLVEWEDITNAVLVAHSYGGLPAIMAADQIADRLTALVFLDSYVAGDGDSAWKVRNAIPGATALPEPEDGLRIAKVPAEIFGLSGEMAEWVNRKLTPHPYKTMATPISLGPNWQSVSRKIYIRLAKYNAPYFDRYYEQIKDDPNWTALYIDEIHNYFMTNPDWFVRMLEEHALS